MIGIVIPVHEKEPEENTIRTIRGIERYTTLPHHIIISGIAPRSVLRESPRIVYLKNQEPRGIARNLGADYAINKLHAQYVAFCDANVLFDERAERWDEKLIDFLHTKEGAIVGPTKYAADKKEMNLATVLVDPREDPKMEKHYTVFYPSFGETPREVPSLCGCFQFMSAQTWRDSIFGYLPGIPCEDYEFCLRMWTLGHPSYVVPSAAVMHIYKPYYEGWDETKGEEYCLTRLLTGLINFDWNTVRRMYEVLMCPNKEKIFALAMKKYLPLRKEVMRRRKKSVEDYYAHFKWVKK
ncbi:hypothetical protein DRN89_03210 [archaeon]|nr:MAG: hypothetical protein DRN89_03210 [archaeon]